MQWSHKVLVVLVVKLGLGEASYWWMQTPAFQGDSGGTEESPGQIVGGPGGGYGESSSQKDIEDSQKSDLKLNNNNPFFTTAESSNDKVEILADNLVELPFTQCPDTMKCVNDMFCDATGSMVQHRVELTSEERERRGSLIPCMNQVTRQFEVCCKKTEESLPQQFQSPPSSFEQLPLPPQPSPPQQFEQQLSPQSCPVLTSLPPLSECRGRNSNCWSVGVADLDCQNNALCCFDGCANVCQGAGPAFGNGKPGVAGAPGGARSQELRNEIESEDANNSVTESNKLVEPQTAGSQSPIFISSQIYEASLGNNNLPGQNSGLENAQPQNLPEFETAPQQTDQQTASIYTYSEEVATKTEPNNEEYTETEKNTVTSNYQPIVFPKDAPESSGYYSSGDIVPAPVKTISPLAEYNTYPDKKEEPLVSPPQKSNVVIVETKGPTTTSTKPPPSKGPTTTSTQPQSSQLTPWVLCPSAMKCVPRGNCDLNGIIVEQKLTFTKELEDLRGPLIPCINRERENVIDVCCRDPNYKGKWQDMSENDGEYDWEESSTQQPLLLGEFSGDVRNQILQTKATKQVGKRTNAYGK